VAGTDLDAITAERRDGDEAVLVGAIVAG